jgi:hypothetical protein
MQTLKYHLLIFFIMPETEEKKLLLQIYNELTAIRAEIDEIKQAIIPEEEPDSEELKEINEGEKEISEGKYRRWKEIKEEL